MSWNFLGEALNFLQLEGCCSKERKGPNSQFMLQSLHPIFISIRWEISVKIAQRRFTWQQGSFCKERVQKSFVSHSRKLTVVWKNHHRWSFSCILSKKANAFLWVFWAFLLKRFIKVLLCISNSKARYLLRLMSVKCHFFAFISVVTFYNSDVCIGMTFVLVMNW